MATCDKHDSEAKPLESHSNFAIMKFNTKISLLFFVSCITFLYVCTFIVQIRSPNSSLKWKNIEETDKFWGTFQPKIEVAGPKCSPVRTFGFIKNHKCGTMALTTMFLRLAEENDLEVILPKVSNWNLNWPNPPRDFYESRKSDGKFDMQVKDMVKLYSFGSKAFLSVRRQLISSVNSYQSKLISEN